MAQTIVPTHQLGLRFGSSEGSVLPLRLRRSWVKGERAMANGPDGAFPSGAEAKGKLDVWTVSSSLRTAVSTDFVNAPRWMCLLATNSSGTTCSLRWLGGMRRVVSLRKNGASMASNVDTKDLYAFAEGAV